MLASVASSSSSGSAANAFANSASELGISLGAGGRLYRTGARDIAPAVKGSGGATGGARFSGGGGGGGISAFRVGLYRSESGISSTAFRGESIGGGAKE